MTAATTSPARAVPSAREAEPRARRTTRGAPGDPLGAADAGSVLRRHGAFVDLAAGRGLYLADEGIGRAGLLVVCAGAVLLEHDRADRRTAELAGTGDVLALDGVTTAVRGLRPTARVYALHSPLPRLLEDLPDVGVRLLAASLHRQRAHHRLLAALHLPRIEDRVLVVLGLAAERFGQRTATGVRMDLGLTHRQLGWIAAARRPSVTTAMGLLQRRGHVTLDEHDRILIDPGAPVLEEAGVLRAVRPPADD